MVFEVPVSMLVYVNVEHGGAAVAARLARDHVVNDWFLRCREGSAKDAGHFVIKGQTGDVGSPRPFQGNRTMTKEEEDDDL